LKRIYAINKIYCFCADLFTESRTLRKRRQTNSTITVTERRRKPVTVSDILCNHHFFILTVFGYVNT